MNVLPADQAVLIKAALNGNRGPMDNAELIALSVMVRPRRADGTPCEINPDGTRVLWPTEILRAWGPRGITAVVWSVVPPCGRCWRRPSRRATCIRCYGKGHLAEEWEHEVITDLDGLVLEDGDGNRL